METQMEKEKPSIDLRYNIDGDISHLVGKINFLLGGIYALSRDIREADSFEEILTNLEGIIGSIDSLGSCPQLKNLKEWKKNLEEIAEKEGWC